MVATSFETGVHTLFVRQEGMVQSEDPRRRDFSSVCLEEYFQWCNKHHNEAQMSKVVKYLTSLSQHAAPQYRQGDQQRSLILIFGY